MSWHGPPLVSDGLAFYGSFSCKVSEIRFADGTTIESCEFTSSAAPSAAEGVEMSEPKIEVGSGWYGIGHNRHRSCIVTSVAGGYVYRRVSADGPVECTPEVLWPVYWQLAPTLPDCNSGGGTTVISWNSPVVTARRTLAQDMLEWAQEKVAREHKPKHSCIRCGGPAYVGLLSVTCERVGGCKTEDERIGEPVVYRVTRGSAEQVLNGCSETVWQAKSSCFTEWHPTREGAIALWRESALAAERLR